MNVRGKEILDQIAKVAQKEFDADACYITIFAGHENLVAGESQADFSTKNHSYKFINLVHKNKKVVNFKSTQIEIPEALDCSDKNHQFAKSFLGIPINDDKNNAIGSLCLFNFQSAPLEHEIIANIFKFLEQATPTISEVARKILLAQGKH